MEKERYSRYMHLEKLGTDEVDGILFGECHIFPKLDGTNGKIWFEDHKIRFGSRNRELSLDFDNAGFMRSCLEAELPLREFCYNHPSLIVFGEWLVPHSLKTYRDEAWHKFYIFDIYSTKTDKWLHIDEINELTEPYKVNVIQPIRIIKNPKLENIEKCLEENKYLIKDGEGCGEGVVIKNYDFVNKFGRTTWAKLVKNEFKEKHTKEMGAPKSSSTKYVEEEIVEEFLTKSITDKIIAKISNEHQGFSSKHIEKLLGVAYYDLIKENSWEFVKKHKNPTIDYKILQKFVIMKVKDNHSKLF